MMPAGGEQPPSAESLILAHYPRGDDAETIVLMSKAFENLAHLMLDLLPSSRETSLALTKLEEAQMWAVAAAARASASR